MPRSHPELDVCLVGHAGLGEVGGVTTWVRGLVASLPDLRVGVITVGDQPTELPAARVYHAMTPAVAAAIAPLARRAGRPVVLTCHAMNEPWAPEGWRGDLMVDASGPGGDPGKGPSKTPVKDGENGDGNNGGGNDDKVKKKASAYIDTTVLVAVSEAVAESHLAAGARAERTLVIPNGVPRQLPTPIWPQEPLVGFVGRLAPIKGIERLLGAMRAVRTAVPDARLVVIGPDEGPPGYADTLRRLADTPGLRGGVLFTGADRPERWYPRMACLALTSETEGMPMAVLEAMSHGVPCVVPRVGGCPEAVGDAGIVVPPRDLDALAGAIAGLLGDSARAAHLGRAAQERSSRWTMADTAAAYAEVYRTVMV